MEQKCSCERMEKYRRMEREMEQRPRMRLGNQLHDSGTSTALRIISAAHSHRVPQYQ